MIVWEDEFSVRLAKLRTQKGVSAREMSLDIAQNANYINHIENKKSFPTMCTFFYICDYFKITPAEFFQEENQNPEKLSILMEKLKKLDEKQLEIICATVEEFLK